MRAKAYSASGMQIAFLVFAVVFLATAADRFLGPIIGKHTDFDRTLGRLYIFVPAVLLLLLVPPLRRRCLEELRVPIPRARKPEVALAAIGHIFTALATGGAIVLWHWCLGGEPGLARRLGNEAPPSEQWLRALSPDGIVTHLILAGIVAPVVEELVIRGMLFRAWAAQWGWFPAMLATSAVFAAYHPNLFSAFIGSILLVCVLRRTGSIRACILVHASYNILLWYPLLGQFMFRTSGRETGEISLWTLHLAALALVLVGLSMYVWMSSDRRIGSDEVPTEMADIRA